MDDLVHRLKTSIPFSRFCGFKFEVILRPELVHLIFKTQFETNVEDFLAYEFTEENDGFVEAIKLKIESFKLDFLRVLSIKDAADIVEKHVGDDVQQCGIKKDIAILGESKFSQRGYTESFRTYLRTYFEKELKEEKEEAENRIKKEMNQMIENNDLEFILKESIRDSFKHDILAIFNESYNMFTRSEIISIYDESMISQIMGR